MVTPKKVKAIKHRINPLIKKAKDLLAQEEYEEAKSLFDRCLLIKPGEKYPERKIKEIDEKLASLREEEKLLADLAKRDEDALDSRVTKEETKEKINKYMTTLKDKEEAGDKAGASTILNEIGNEYHNINELGQAIEYYKCKEFVGVPVMFQMLVNSPDFTKRDLSSLESAVSGSATLASELNKKWQEVVGFKVGQGFGLTETSPVTHNQPKWLPEIIPESIGIPIIDTDAKIVDPDTFEELPPGEIGELFLKGPQVMKGYWKNPEATAATFVGDWLRTGDLARMDERGYFYIEGRTKDMIKYKGYKVMPKEVEEKLYEHPAVLEAGVVSAPDPNIGETIKAYIALKPDYQGKITEQEIIDWSKEKMAAYKYPRKVEFVTVLPRTSVGKIFRRKLRERAAREK